MSQAESRLSRKIVSALNAEGYFAWKNHGSEYTLAGLPDIIVCAKGQFFGLEVKTPSKKDNVSASQKLILQKINDAGGQAVVVTTVEQAVGFVQKILDHLNA